MMRVQTGQQTFHVELQPLRTFPVADITFEGVGRAASTATRSVSA
jgi:hypothetical protein